MKLLQFAASSVLILTNVAVHDGLAAPRATEFGPVRLTFEPNRGQADPSVRYLSRAPGHTLLLRDNEAALAFPEGAGSVQTVSFQWLGSRARALQPEQPTGGLTNYLTAGIRQTGIPHFARVRYAGLYRGIDLVYYGAEEKKLEYDLIVKPGANPRQARFRVSGARAVTIRDGDLYVSLAGREVRHKKPFVYQTIDGTRRIVHGEYVLLGRNEVGFRIASYDKSHELIIDPVLSYTLLRAGNSVDQATSIAVDAAGNAYVAGSTTSANFPLVAPFRSAFQGSSEAFVMKLSPAGQIAYLTFLGGSGADAARGIAVDDTGSVYVTGDTSSADMFAAPVRGFSGGTDAFLAKISSAGNQISYGTYIGGGGTDFGQGVALNAAKEAFVTGWTTSTNLNGIARTGTSTDAFLVRVNAAGTAIAATAYSGGTGDDSAYAIAVDGSGNVYIGGETASTNLAGTAIQPGYGGGLRDAFLAKWDASGNPVYWAYLGGSDFDVIRGITTDSSGAVYVAGATRSANFPRVSAIQNAHGGVDDAFVTKLNSLGTAIIYSTLLGGNQSDQAYGIAVDSGGSAHVAGLTTSTANFPLVGTIKTTLPTGTTTDAFVTRINAAGNAWLYSTLLGGSHNDVFAGIALDAANSAYAAGYTQSSEITGNVNGAPADALVMKISDACSYSVAPLSMTVTAGSQIRTVTINTAAGCGWSATKTGEFMTISGPASGTGPGTVSVAFSGNPGLARSGSLTVAGQIIPVTQTGSISAGCTYTLSSNSTSVSAAATNATLTLNTTSTCQWQAYSSASWLEVFPLSGTGTSTIQYSVYPNFRPAARSATMTIAGQTFTVNQAANTLSADERFVQLLYFSFFGRLPSAAELNFQVTNGLGGPTKDYAALVMNFLNSEEFNIGGRFVAGLYVGLLDRNPEFGGWQFQRNAYSSGQISPQALVGNFLGSQEYALRFGNPDNQEFVRLLYRYILLREGSQAEIDFQASQLQPQGGLTRAGLAINFLSSNEFRQGTGARLTAFLLYATLLLRDPSPAEMQARITQLTNATQATIKQIAGEFIQSPEFKAVVGWP